MIGITQRTVLQDQVAILMQRLAETNKALQSLLADEEDSILCPGGKSFLLIPAQESLVPSEEMQRLEIGRIPKRRFSHLSL
jgi:hypothetical protein